MSRLADVLATCDGAFLSTLDGTGAPPPVSSEASVQASNELTELLADRALAPQAEVEAVVLPWARARLTHVDVAAWERGAQVLAVLAQHRRVPPAEAAAIVDELVAMVERPIQRDNKELQAKSAAVTALGWFGAVAGLHRLAGHQFARDRDFAAELKAALARCAGKQFASLPAARRWAEAQLDAARAHQAAWQQTLDASATAPTAYSPRTTFAVGAVLDHPTFGRGVIDRLIEPSKIEVRFSTGVRVLAHRR